MRILQLHTDFIEYEPLRKEIEDAEDAERLRHRLEEALVLFTCVEEGDDETLGREAIDDVNAFFEGLKGNRVLIYPYAHLSTNLAKPEKALKVLRAMEEHGRRLGLETYRAPFGWSKQFTISVKGHPLAEQSRTYSLGRVRREVVRRGEDIPVKFSPKDERSLLWHTSSHILATATKRLYPDVKLGFGLSDDEGFHYDFYSRSFSKEDLMRIEEEMKGIISRGLKFERKAISKGDARELFSDERYKIEAIEELPEETVSIFKLGDFVDICDGPHIEDIGQIGALKLLKTSGAYWRGVSSNPMLQRIYGISFSTQKELEEYLKHRDEVEKRDHRRIGPRLDLFGFHEEAPGMVFLHQKGLTIRNVLLDLWRREHQKQGYLEVSTPMILNRRIWEQSGHWENYRANMFLTEVEGSDYAIKPMNCPGAILIYKSKPRSYKELPLRLAEIGTVHRNELSGVLSGLFRVRSLTQDDAHIFLTSDQLEEEIVRVIGLTGSFYKIFGFDYHAELSTRPERSIGSDEGWKTATDALKGALEKKGMEFKVKEGEGAFYGPKVDFHIRDSLGRSWQCATIQVDFAIPERFGLKYVGSDGKEHKPVMIHRVIYGSLERFIGMLVEHFAGAFPVWLAPVQVMVLPISDENIPYAKKVEEELKRSGIRAEADYESSTIGYKVRNAQLQKVPYMLVVGSKEVESMTVSVRRREGRVIHNVKLDEFIGQVLDEVRNFKQI